MVRHSRVKVQYFGECTFTTVINNTIVTMFSTTTVEAASFATPAPAWSFMINVGRRKEKNRHLFPSKMPYFSLSLCGHL